MKTWSSVDNPERIYLQPKCCADPIEGREVYWGDSPPWDDCEDGEKPVEYIRADIADNLKLRLDQILDDLSAGSMEFPGHGVCKQAWDEAIEAIEKAGGVE